MAQIYFLKYREINDGQFEELLPLVSEERRQKVKRYADIDKKRQSLFAKLLLRAVLCRKFKIANEDLKFSADAHGKPFFENIDNVYFSVSHTSSGVAVAVSEDEIGVDIEKVRAVILILPKGILLVKNMNISLTAEKNKTRDFSMSGPEKRHE